MTAIPVKAERMLSDLRHLRQFGASGSGVARQAFSDPDVAARRWLAERMGEAGLTVRIDSIGNLFGLPPGDAPAVLVGSHSDTQPLGGWLDGAYGVIVGLELARASLESGGPPIAAVSWQDEEGRFGGLTGSAVWAGRLAAEAADGFADSGGQSFRDLRQRVSEIAEVGSVPPSRFAAYIEAHIEQGPVLDTAGETVGVVEHIVGSRQLTLRFEGQANHAGTTPMPLRRDAFQCACKTVAAVNRAFAELAAPATVWTVGRILVEPNAPSIVPGVATMTLQFRDAEIGRLEAMQAAALGVAQSAAEENRIVLSISEGFAVDPVAMDESWIARLAEAAAARAPDSWRRMPSGAMHDASEVAAVLPSAMLFVPSLGGISHNPTEDTRPEDLAAGLETLAIALG